VPAAGRLTAPATSKVRSGTIYCKDLVIDRDKHKVTVREQRLELTPKEFDLLWLMASYPGKTFSRHELLELIWGFAFQEYEHTVTSHINRLRIKLEKNLDKPEYILTTWGTGYRFAE
jgi:DNA-binding response OmpR family regulator